MEKEIEKLKNAILFCLQSPNECDSNGENANIVDALCRLSRSIHRLCKIKAHELGVTKETNPELYSQWFDS